MNLQQFKKKNFAFCINAGEYQGVSLFALKMYEYLPDPISEAEGFLRVIDEEGEPYYYDAKAFVKVKTASKGFLIPFFETGQKTRKKPFPKMGAAN
jgi:hypothetical protein